MTTRTFESEALIRFPDCDPFNHLNNARYLDYFMNAREDHLRAFMHFDLYRFAAERGMGWVVALSRIAYVKPATLMETVVIDSTLIAWREKDVTVEMRMWDRDKARLKSLLWATFAFVDVKTGRPIPHFPDIVERFAPLESPVPEESFEERLAVLRGGGG